LGSFIPDSLPYWGEIKEKRGQHALLYFLFLFGIKPAESLSDMVISSRSRPTMQDHDTVLVRRWSDFGTNRLDKKSIYAEVPISLSFET
jgi:hypothetical protein